MARYKLVVKRSVAKDLRSIPKKDIGKILERIETLAFDPRPDGAKKLNGAEKYRARQGSYRIVYEIEDEIITVTIVKVGHRKNVYR